MGELHIEIIHDRIRREYGIETYLGPLQVAYRETILSDVSTTGANISGSLTRLHSSQLLSRNEFSPLIS